MAAPASLNTLGKSRHHAKGRCRTLCFEGQGQQKSTPQKRHVCMLAERLDLIVASVPWHLACDLETSFFHDPRAWNALCTRESDLLSDLILCWASRHAPFFCPPFGIVFAASSDPLVLERPNATVGAHVSLTEAKALSFLFLKAVAWMAGPRMTVELDRCRVNFVFWKLVEWGMG